MKRRIYEKIWLELAAFQQMVFIAGPRQAGKTTFTKQIAKTFANSLYFNWDIIDEKRNLLENPSFYEEMDLQDNSKPLVIFDELHKHPDWKNYLKSVYDRDKDNFKFIVSGSGRLDLYQSGGDSLAGRYLQFYFWPFTLAELAGLNRPFEEFVNHPLNIPVDKANTREIWELLKRFSGFPDPYLNGSDRFYRLWSNTYKKQLIREDIRDLTAVRNLENMEMLFSLIPSRIGSPLSMANLASDIGVSFDSVKKWISIFDDFFLSFRLSPWTAKISRAIKKEKKIYLFDYAGVSDEGKKLENMVAVELWRAVNNWSDRGLGNFSLGFIRNREKDEVDFIVTQDDAPILLIEAKLSSSKPTRSLLTFQNKLNLPAVQLTEKPGVCNRISNNGNKLLTISADRWLARLP